MKKNDYILSILIPTYNREKYLDKALESFFSQIDNQIVERIEILVSDNDSKDKTQEILKKYQNKIPEVKYEFWKNEENIGADRNFLKLIEKSKGQFCWIFGDDEYLTEGSLKKVVALLENNRNSGNIYISNQDNKKIKKIKLPNEYLLQENYWISFITANIFNKKYLTNTADADNFIGSYLVQEIFYLKSIFNSPYNIIFDEKIFKTDRDETQESFGLFQVFGENQNKIFEYFEKDGFEQKTRDCINKKILKEFLPGCVLHAKKMGKNYKWKHEDIFKEMKKTFSKYLEFYIFCVPLIKLPYSLGKIYYLFIRIINKLKRITSN